jgi:hypothetical protein
MHAATGEPSATPSARANTSSLFYFYSVAHSFCSTTTASLSSSSITTMAPKTPKTPKTKNSADPKKDYIVYQCSGFQAHQAYRPTPTRVKQILGSSASETDVEPVERPNVTTPVPVAEGQGQDFFMYIGDKATGRIDRVVNVSDGMGSVEESRYLHIVRLEDWPSWVDDGADRGTGASEGKCLNQSPERTSTNEYIVELPAVADEPSTLEDQATSTRWSVVSMAESLENNIADGQVKQNHTKPKKLSKTKKTAKKHRTGEQKMKGSNMTDEATDE